MYSVSKLKKKKQVVDNYQLINFDGLIMSKKGLKINNQVIRNLKVVNEDIAHILAYDKAIYKYNKLINLLTDLLTSDDDSGDNYRHALNQIEKFRLEIKNKYRKFLKQKELEKMSRKLMTLKKEAEKRLIEMNEYQKDYSSRKSR